MINTNSWYKKAAQRNSEPVVLNSGGILQMIPNTASYKPLTRRAFNHTIRGIYYALDMLSDVEDLIARLKQTGIKDSEFLWRNMPFEKLFSHSVKSGVSLINCLEKHGEYKINVRWDAESGRELQLLKGADLLLETNDIYKVRMFVEVRLEFEKLINTI